MADGEKDVYRLHSNSWFVCMRKFVRVCHHGRMFPMNLSHNKEPHIQQNSLKQNSSLFLYP